MKFLMVTIYCCLLSCLGLAQSRLQIYTELLPPWQTQGPAGEAAGPAVEVVKEIQRRVGNTDPIQIVPWARGYALVQSQPNVVLFLMARTAERNDLFQWVGPIDEGKYGLYVKSDSQIVINDLEAAKTLKSIGVYRGDARDQILTKAGFTNLDRSNANSICVKKLMSGRIDAMTSANSEVNDLVKEAGFSPSDVKLALAFFRFQGWIAFSKLTPATTIKAWDDAFESMKKDRTFSQIMKRGIPSWTPPSAPITAF
jgi:polar amino acid transport system substrate-binding protein